MSSTGNANELRGDYHDSLEYRMASPQRRRQINRYKKECGISDDHMFLLLFKRELDAVPLEKRRQADQSGLFMITLGVLALVNSLRMIWDGSASQTLALTALGFVAFVMAVVAYVTGMLNEHKRAYKKVTKLLKDMPEVPDMDAWMEEHPAPASPTTKRRRK